MKTILSILLLLFTVTVTAQQVGDIVSRTRSLESVGDTAYYLNDTLRTYNERLEIDVETSRKLLGDSTETDTKLSDFAFPPLNEISSAITKALQFRATIQRVTVIVPLINQLTGLNIFQYTGKKFGDSLTGNYVVVQDGGNAFQATLTQLENHTLRLVRLSDNANWVVQAYGRNMFVLKNFDHDNNAGTPIADYLFNFYLSNEGGTQYLPVESITGETNQLIMVKVQ